MRWTDADNLAAKDALVVAGPHDGLRVAVAMRGGMPRIPDVFDMTDYRFDPDAWQFVFKPAGAPR